MVDFRRRVDTLLSRATRTFGEEVYFYPTSGGTFKVFGVFDNEHEAIDPDTEQLISSNRALLGINLNDFRNNVICDGDKFKVRNIFYKVIDTQEDGQGGAKVVLHRIREDEKVNIRKYPRNFKK